MPYVRKMDQDSKYYFRFFLEVMALIFMGWWGASFTTGWTSFFTSALLVVLFMVVWGVFNVPGDPSRSGNAPVVVSGKVRLAIEFILFLFATYAIWHTIGFWYALLFLFALVAHYIHIKDRVRWLWEK